MLPTACSSINLYRHGIPVHARLATVADTALTAPCSLDDDATVTGGRFAVTEDVGSASDDLNISIWDTPGGTLLYETTVTGSQYTKESEFPNDFGTSNY